MKEEEDSDSEVAASNSNVTVSVGEAFQRHRLSRYSRSLRRFSRHDFVSGSVSPLDSYKESGFVSCATGSGPISSRLTSENRASLHSHRRLSCEVRSNPESPQRTSMSPIQFTMCTLILCKWCVLSECLSSFVNLVSIFDTTMECYWFFWWNSDVSINNVFVCTALHLIGPSLQPYWM